MSIPILTIKDNLRTGDQIKIAESLECSKYTVYKVLSGKQGARKTALQTRIINLAIELGAKNIEVSKILEPQTAEA